ncbi:hypothetical protein BCV70DRAFT_202755 [Testicularia cyperi]|uniref:Uncharacterized protein n=1 Tax=Testicularia cyperi TaxID=1882483 RepID=A0A317XI40_9BASI|nr:hypothetical protein BCV70DRAFT_202755 [Testicularia cyperi]
MLVAIVAALSTSPRQVWCMQSSLQSPASEKGRSWLSTQNSDFPFPDTHRDEVLYLRVVLLPLVSGSDFPVLLAKENTQNQTMPTATL